MRICLPPCAITSETGIVCRCDASTSTRLAVPTKRRFCVCRLHSPFFPFPSPSLSLSLSLSISIPHGVLFIVASRRYVPVRGSHATFNPCLHICFGVVLRLLTLVSMWFAYLPIISPVLPYTL